MLFHGAGHVIAPQQHTRRRLHTITTSAVTATTSQEAFAMGSAATVTPSPVRISFSSHVNNSLHHKRSHPRRTLLTDLATHVTTDAEVRLWHELYHSYTNNGMTNWQAMLIEFNRRVRSATAATTPDQVLWTKNMKHLKSYLQTAVKNEQQRLLTQPSLPVAQPTYTGVPSQTAQASSSHHQVPNLMAALQLTALLMQQQQQQAQLPQNAGSQNHSQAAMPAPLVETDARAARAGRMQKLAQKRSLPQAAGDAVTRPSKRGGQGTSKRCNSCWNLLAGSSGHNKWPGHCAHNCAACGQSMKDHQKPCPRPTGD